MIWMVPVGVRMMVIWALFSRSEVQYIRRDLEYRLEWMKVAKPPLVWDS